MVRKAAIWPASRQRAGTPSFDGRVRLLWGSSGRPSPGITRGRAGGSALSLPGV